MSAEPVEEDLVRELRQAADRLHRLQRLSSQLTNARDVDDVVVAVMQHLDAPVGASTRALWLQEIDADHLTLVAQQGLKPEAAELFVQIDQASPLPGAIAIRERRTIVSLTASDASERFPQIHDETRSADGFAVVPLLGDDEPLGVLAFGFNGAIDDADIVFLEAAAGHVAQTLQRVRLDEALERRAADAGFLAEVAHATIGAGDHHELMIDVAQAVLPRLGTWASLHFVAEPGAAIETVVVHDDAFGDEWANRLAAKFALDPTSAWGVAAVLRTGQTEHVATFDDIHSVVTVPIVSKRRVIGALQVVHSGGDRRHTTDDVELAETVASRIGDALENRWLTDQHRHISASLQRAFLPPVLPHIQQLDVAAAYWPAGVASDVGGDFYDIFRIGETRWAVVIGDACGTGPDAAAVAAIARHTTRAAARHDFDHRTVVEWVNQAVRFSDRDLFATLCYATVDIAESYRVQVASAGHPLPLAITADAVEPIGRYGTLLGVFEDIDITVEETVLAPGDALVFWTDGVTDLPPPYGCSVDHLSDLLAAHHDRPASQIIADVRQDLDDRVSEMKREDDVALLVLRRPT